MRFSKKMIALLAGAALAVVGVVGCGDSKSTETTEEAEVVEEVEGEEAAAEVAGDFVTAWLTLIVGGDEQASEAYEESDGDAEKFFDSIETAKYVSFADMSKNEVREFKEMFYYMGQMGMVQFDEDAPTVVFTLPADAVTIDGDTAMAAMVQGVATIDGEVADDAAEGIGLPELELVRDDGKWKVSGRYFMEVAEQAADADSE